MSTELPDFEDSSKWVKRPDRTCFMQHDRRDPKGKMIENVDKKRLEAIAKEMNARDARGQLCPITFGHTNDDEDETKQPPHEGYGRHFKVAWDEDKKKWVIKATYYIRREKFEDAKTFPNVSPEYWPADGILSPISLLRREPKLDLGQWVYGKKGRVVRYMMESDMAEEKTPDDQGAHKASADPAEKGIGDDTPDPSPQQTNEDDGSRSGPEGVDPAFHSNYSKCAEHMYKSGQHHKYMLAYPHHPEREGMAMPSATNATTPAAGATGAASQESPARMQKADAATAVRNVELERQVEELRGRLAVQEKKERLARYEKNLMRLRGAGYEFDVSKMVDRCDKRNFDDGDFADLVADIQVNYRRTAGHQGDAMIQTAAARSGLDFTEDTNPNEFKDEDLPVAQQYQRDNHKKLRGLPVEEAWEQAKDHAIKYRKSKNGVVR